MRVLPLLLVMFLAGGAAAQTTADMARELNRLRDDVSALQRRVYQGATPPPAAAAGGEALGGEVANRLSGRIDTLEGQLRDLTGRTEEVDFRVRQLQQRLDKLAEDIDFRLQQLERPGQPGPAQAQAGAATVTPPPSAAPPAQAGAAQPLVAAPPSAPAQAAPAAPGAAPGGTLARQEGPLGTLVVDSTGRVTGATVNPGATRSSGAPPAPAAPQQAAPQQQAAAPVPPAARAPMSGTPEEKYNASLGLLQRQDFAAAEQGLADFVRQHGDHPLASNAQYWLGESHYARGQFERAATAFLTSYQRFPRGNKAPDSLVKLGMSLNNLNQKQEACAVYAQFGREYPQALPALRQLANVERQKAGCR